MRIRNECISKLKNNDDKSPTFLFMAPVSSHKVLLPASQGAGSLASGFHTPCYGVDKSRQLKDRVLVANVKIVQDLEIRMHTGINPRLMVL